MTIQEFKNKIEEEYKSAQESLVNYSNPITRDDALAQAYFKSRVAFLKEILDCLKDIDEKANCSDRDSDLHTPLVKSYKSPYGTYSAHAYCSVCGEPLADTDSERSEEDAISNLKSQMYKYCPNCGVKVR